MSANPLCTARGVHEMYPLFGHPKICPQEHHEYTAEACLHGWGNSFVRMGEPVRTDGGTLSYGWVNPFVRKGERFRTGG